MNKAQLMKEELNKLREELKSLKECQTHYIALSVASVSAIFSYFFQNSGGVIRFIPDIQTDIKINSIYLIPLVIILPVSCIFFNKATTISRIVGYYQLLEDFCLEKNKEGYIGWENSLRNLREYGRDREKLIKQYFGPIKLWEHLSPISKIEYFFRIFGFNMEPLHRTKYSNSTIQDNFFRIFGFDLESLNRIKYSDNIIQNKSLKDFGKPQTYWELVFATFFAMCVLCFILAIGPAIVFGIKHFITGIFIENNESNLLNLIVEAVHEDRFNFLLLWVFLAISIYVFRYNLKILYQLERGFHSYYANYVFWNAIIVEKIDKEKVYALKYCPLPSESEKGIIKIDTESKFPKAQIRMAAFFAIYLVVMLLILLV